MSSEKIFPKEIFKLTSSLTYDLQTVQALTHKILSHTYKDDELQEFKSALYDMDTTIAKLKTIFSSTLGESQ